MSNRLVIWHVPLIREDRHLIELEMNRGIAKFGVGASITVNQGL
jgi:hypothetical protein